MPEDVLVIGFDEGYVPTLAALIRANREGWGAVYLTAREDIENELPVGSWARWTWTRWPWRAEVCNARVKKGIWIYELAAELNIPQDKLFDIEQGKEKLQYHEYKKILRIIAKMEPGHRTESRYETPRDQEPVSRGAGGGAGVAEAARAPERPAQVEGGDAVVRSPGVVPEERRSGRLLLGVLGRKSSRAQAGGTEGGGPGLFGAAARAPLDSEPDR